MSFNDDLETDDFFTTPRTPFGRTRFGRENCFGDLREACDDNAAALDEGISQKIKSVQHMDTVSQ